MIRTNKGYTVYTHEGYTELVKLLSTTISLESQKKQPNLDGWLQRLYLIFLYHVLLVEEIQYTAS